MLVDYITKILTADEVKANYDKTVAYHNVLVQSKN